MLRHRSSAPWLTASLVAVFATVTGLGHAADLVADSAAGLPPAGFCPVRRCRGGTNKALAGANTALPATARECPDAACKESCVEKRLYDVTFKPGHFVCTGCDVSACEGCSILCDMSRCVGEFYTTECWCQEGSDSAPRRVFCDRDCEGGVCGTHNAGHSGHSGHGGGQNLQCRRREDACKPWWWCGSAPPVRPMPTKPPPEEALLQQRLETHRGVIHRRGRLNGRRASSSALLAAQSDSRVLPPAPENENDYDEIDFQVGRFTCGSAALPPRVKDPLTGELTERGYLVLDRRSCVGSLFNVQCYCYDAAAYLAGEEPVSSPLKCDATCKWGPCDGKTCKREPPARLTPAPFAPPVFEDTRRHVDIVMEPLDKSTLTR